jgi:hypothetical protein
MLVEQPRLPDTDHPARPKLTVIHQDVLKAIIYGLEQAGYAVTRTDDPAVLSARSGVNVRYVIETTRVVEDV